MSGVQNAFAFIRSAGGIGYKWLGQTQTSGTLNTGASATSMFSGSNTLSTSPVAWNISQNYGVPGIIADGNTIVMRTGRSDNNGATWYDRNLNGYYTTAYLLYASSGPNGGVAYDPITKARASIYNDYDPKAGGWSSHLDVLTSSNASFQVGIAGAYAQKQAIWWPLQNYFYSPFVSGSYVLGIGPTSGTQAIFTVGNGSTQYQKYCVDPSTGYMIGNLSGSLYEFYNYDLSSNSYIGTDNVGTMQYQSTPIKGFGGYWYKTANYSSDGYCQVYISAGTSYPTNWSPIGTVSTYSQGVRGQSMLYYDATNAIMYCCVNWYQGGSYPGFGYTTASSTDGSTWTTVANLMSIIKNLK